MASSIVLFQNVREFYRTLGILPPQNTNDKTSARWSMFNAKTLFFSFSFLRMSISTIAFCIYQANSTFEYGVTNYVFGAELACMFYFSVQVRKIDDIIALITNYENFIEKRLQHDPHNQSKYIELNEKIEWMSKILHFILVKLTLPGLLAPAISLTMMNYFIYDLGIESFCLPCPLMLPFDWRTPMGYLMALCIEWMAVFSIIQTTIPVMCFFIGSCWLYIAFAKDITNDLNLLDIGGFESNEGRTKIKLKLCHIAQIHSDAKQFISAFNSAYEFMVPGVYLWLLSTFCVTYLMLGYDYNLAELTVTSIVSLWSIILTFAQCEIGDQVSKQFQAFSTELEQCDWYCLPIDAQQTLAIIFLNAQQASIIQGQCNTKFTRHSFKKAYNGGYYFFLIFHKINNYQTLKMA